MLKISACGAKCRAVDGACAILYRVSHERGRHDGAHHTTVITTVHHSTTHHSTPQHTTAHPATATTHFHNRDNDGIFALVAAPRRNPHLIAQCITTHTALRGIDDIGVFQAP